MVISFDVRLDRCVVCGGPLAPFDAAVIQGVTVRYHACSGCGLVQMNPRPSPVELERFYESAYRTSIGDEEGARTGDAQQRRARQQREFAGRRPHRHLDVGCSMGTLLQEFGGDHQVGVEPGTRHRRQAEAAGVEVYETLEDLVASEPEPFDLITMSHVLEHLPDPVGYLPALRPLLAPGGRLLVEVPSLYRSIAYEIAHLLVFTEASLTATLRAGGFAVTDTSVHKARQGGLGIGRNIAVLAVPGEAADPPRGHVSVRGMQLRRHVGFAPQRFYRWRHRQQRRVRRNVRRVVRRR